MATKESRTIGSSPDAVRQTTTIDPLEVYREAKKREKRDRWEKQCYPSPNSYPNWPTIPDELTFPELDPASIRELQKEREKQAIMQHTTPELVKLANALVYELTYQDVIAFAHFIRAGSNRRNFPATDAVMAEILMRGAKEILDKNSEAVKEKMLPWDEENEEKPF